MPRSLQVRPEDVELLGCARLYDGSEHGGAVGKGDSATTAHFGSHPLNMLAYTRQWQFNEVVAPQVREAFASIARKAGLTALASSGEPRRVRVIATWCNAVWHLCNERCWRR